MPVHVQVSFEVVTPATLPDLICFFRAVEASAHPNDPAASDRAEAGLRHSLTALDFLQVDENNAAVRPYWPLLARVEGKPAGYLFAVRIPKADHRCGFLFVDELYIHPAYRRQGLGRGLLEQVQTLASQLELAGVRLLVRPENETGRALYRRCGFQESPTGFCQWLV